MQGKPGFWTLAIHGIPCRLGSLAGAPSQEQRRNKAVAPHGLRTILLGLGYSAQAIAMRPSISHALSGTLRSSLICVFIFGLALSAPNTAYAEDMFEFLKTHAVIKTTTGCFKPGTPPGRNCVSKSFVRNNQLVLEGSGCSSWTVPVNGGTIKGGTRVTPTFSENTFSVALAADNGLVFHETTTLSARWRMASVLGG
jgi:hypothetical protein